MITEETIMTICIFSIKYFAFDEAYSVYILLAAVLLRRLRLANRAKLSHQSLAGVKIVKRKSICRTINIYERFFLLTALLLLKLVSEKKK